jgi:hypothetical protein
MKPLAINPDADKYHDQSLLIPNRSTGGENNYDNVAFGGGLNEHSSKKQQHHHSGRHSDHDDGDDNVNDTDMTSFPNETIMSRSSNLWHGQSSEMAISNSNLNRNSDTSNFNSLNKTNIYMNKFPTKSSEHNQAARGSGGNSGAKSKSDIKSEDKRSKLFGYKLASHHGDQHHHHHNSSSIMMNKSGYSSTSSSENSDSNSSSRTSSQSSSRTPSPSNAAAATALASTSNSNKRSSVIIADEYSNHSSHHSAGSAKFTKTMSPSMLMHQQHADSSDLVNSVDHHHHHNHQVCKYVTTTAGNLMNISPVFSTANNKLPVCAVSNGGGGGESGVVPMNKSPMKGLHHNR